MEPDIITVGLDGSSESLAAAQWAADEADRRQSVLRLLHAWILLAAEAPGTPPDRDQNAGARQLVRQVLDAVRERHPHLQIIEDLVGAEAEPALLRAAGESQMLVLGSRALGAWESYVLGDISLDVVGRAEGPVVLVRAPGHTAAAPAERPPTVPDPRVVVGMGLTAPCDGLLAFAFDAAATRGLPLQAVHGRPLPVHAYAPWGVDPDAEATVVKEAQDDLRAAIDPWSGRFPEVTVQLTVLPESPARAVVRTAPGAELLVVGRGRHRHALAPRVGPVAHAAIHHVTCPVVVVPHD
ncbi:universal stress protein [Streptomyces natalensis]|uniref:Stress-inducible protein n=1 Tax=Streptomyces natalensis ATCC 27448 TaxID=1240678 RepID=A0A0D7CJA4_9ACTN|nr:universal stress protein [Streptomyces natalensis]KIZ16151.1 stress-inducible protein [Streptomyces natalensis ATCC 27448]